MTVFGKRQSAAAALRTAADQAAFLLLDLRGGTLAPFWRALLNPIAIACLRFLTGCLPDFMWCISVRTSSCAFGPYLRPLDFLLLDLRELDLRLLDELWWDELRREEDLVAIGILPLQWDARSGAASCVQSTKTNHKGHKGA
jgi:hypothetical protein